MRERWADYFKKDAVRFVYNGTATCLKISNVFVYPQGYGAIVPMANSLAEIPRTFVIDIGGYTTDVLLFNKTKPDTKFCWSFEIGVIHMCNEIIHKVKAQYGILLVEEQIIGLLTGDKNLCLYEDVVNTIKTMTCEYVKKMIDELRENKVELKANPAIFVGGGAILFKPYIAESPMIVKADFVFDPKANAIGYKMLTSERLRQLSV